MRPALLLLVPILVLLEACSGPTSRELERAQEIQRQIDAVETLCSEQELPNHLMESPSRKRGSEFDVMRTLACFPHLRTEEGYVLDYVYHCEGAGGEPIVYARKKTEPPFADEAAYLASIRTRAHLDEVERVYGDYRNEIAKAANDLNASSAAFDRMQKRLAGIPDHHFKDWYLEHISTDGSDDGFIELAALHLIGDKFYLFWHAAYKQCTVVLTREKAMQAMGNLGHSKAPVALPSDRPPKITSALLCPKVVRTETTVTVSIHAFSKWGGLYRYSYEFSRESPHRMNIRKPENIVPYDCGLVF